MENYLVKIKELAQPIVEKYQLKLVKVIKIKEFGASIVQIVIDDPETFTIDVDIVAKINEEILDEVNDYIPDGYYLEVASLGIERELETEADLEKAINQYIYVSTYQKIPTANNLKEIYGYLRENKIEELIIEINLKGIYKKVSVLKKDIAKMRLAVKF